MRRDDFVDFHAVAREHFKIHERLTNWGRWCNGSYSPGVAPGFELYRSPADQNSDAPEGAPSIKSVDGSDACRVNSVVLTLPENRRAALTWCYCRPIAPRRQAREMGITPAELAWLLNDGRERLINQGA
jgi:DNA-directed RNA polymerase specialized sigma24 family protein